MNESLAPPPPNGFTKGMRRIVAVICLVAFVGLLVGDFSGSLSKDVPLTLYVFLLAGASMMNDALYEMFKIFGVKK